jgi:hypothetical protein
VTRVGLENYQHPSSCCLVIDCIHPGPMIERKTSLPSAVLLPRPPLTFSRPSAAS